MSRAVVAYLEQQVLSADDSTRAHWVELESLYSRRLWHQLTLALQAFVVHPHFTGPHAGLPELYAGLIKDIEDRIAPAALVGLVEAVAGQLPDPASGLAFLAPFSAKVAADPHASVQLVAVQAALHLALDDAPAAAKLLDAAGARLDDLDGGVTPTHATYYRVRAGVAKRRGDHATFYECGLQYLSCVDADSLGPGERVTLAFDLGLAALLGTGVYNFGLLLAHPVLRALHGTELAWLIATLQAFNAGDLDAVASLAPQWRTQPDLAAAETFLLEKATLLALMEAVFRRDARARTIALADLAAETRVASVAHVELLVMKAMSLGLVRGSIDQIDQTATLPWVQPRVLNTEQLAAMRARLEAWSMTVEAAAQGMVAAAPALFASAD